jgi:hypothetical protein
MAYVSPESKWYVAELIEEITIEGDPHNVVHRNVTLIYANSPEEAYGKALTLGKENEGSYENPERKLVRTKFWGLGELNVLHDDLKHGAQFYQEQIGVPGEKLNRWVLPKKNLSAFLPLKTTAATNHSSTAQQDHNQAKSLNHGGRE